MNTTDLLNGIKINQNVKFIQISFNQKYSISRHDSHSGHRQSFGDHKVDSFVLKSEL